MLLISGIAVLMAITVIINACFSRVAAQRVLGIKVSFVKASAIVTVRLCAGMLSGLLIGYGLRIGVIESKETYRMIGCFVTSGLSFCIYWYLMGKLNNTKIKFISMAKTLGLEVSMIMGTALVIGILILFIGYLSR